MNLTAPHPHPDRHVMLDLETLSTAKDAAILQIAAVVFDAGTGETGAEFNAYVRHPSGHVDTDTVLWWMQQAQAAALGKAASNGVNEAKALDQFREWLQAINPAALWSHGATFDIVVLGSAYRRHEVVVPWSYRLERDTRTLFVLAPGGMPKVAKDESRVHDALYDCHVQIKQVVGALQALRAGEAVRCSE